MHLNRIVTSVYIMALASNLVGADAAPAASAGGDASARADRVLAAATTWLLAQQQADGSFGAPEAKMTLGITALATAALDQSPGLPANDDHLKRALTYLLAHRQPDGGFYVPEEGLAVYGTSVALLALEQAGGADATVVSSAQGFLRKAQVSDPTSPSDGGFSYGGTQGGAHADLSNTHLALRALRASGVPASDAAVQHAIAFLEHCQQLTAVNHLGWVDSSPEQAGSGVYTPDPQPRKPRHGETAPQPPAKPSGYGSMTWALLDGYRQAGVASQDIRPAQALAWLERHYTMDENPGRASGKNSDGLYYGYWMKAQALSGAGAPVVVTPDGSTHDWRADLLGALEKRAQHDATGSFWVNEAKAWSETNPIIVTSYVVQTLKLLRTSP
jgi:squalene-hopene/tetraprenyl-beta-curcumene cyclase